MDRQTFEERSITVSAIGAIVPADLPNIGRTRIMSFAKKTGKFDTEAGIVTGANPLFKMTVNGKGVFLAPVKKK